MPKRNIVTDQVTLVEFLLDHIWRELQALDKKLNTNSEVAIAFAKLTKAVREHFNIRMINCSICSCDTPAALAHLHQGKYIGECCWDERLRSTE